MNPEKPNVVETNPEASAMEEKFKESKVRDDEGNLLKVYHFSDEDISEFSLEHTGKNYEGDTGFFGDGVYFTDSQEDFQYGAKRYVAHLNLKNPLVVKNPSIEDVKKLHGERDVLQEQGYDGVMVWNDASEDEPFISGKMKGSIKGREAGWSEICVFNPEDILVIEE